MRQELDQLHARIADLERRNEQLTNANRGLLNDAARLKRLLEGAEEAFWDWNLETQDFVVSDKFEPMLGYRPGDLDLSPGKWAEHVHPDDLARALESIDQHLAGLKPNHEVEVRCFTKSGGYTYILTRGRVVGRDSSGKPTMMAGTFNDIHKRKQAEAALRDSEALFKGLTETLPGFVFVADGDGRNIYLNPACAAYTGRPMSELLGDGWTHCVHPEDIEGLTLAWQSAVIKGADFGMQYRFRRHDGAYRWFLCQSRPVRDSDSDRIGRWVGIGIDIHDQKMAEAEIHRFNAELEQRVSERTAELTAANRELEGFTFAASHDLKGPLGRISSFSAMLTERYRDCLEGDGLVLLEFIRQNAVRLNQLVDDLLCHARVAQQPLELQPVDLPAAVRQVLQEKFVEICEVGATINLDVSPAKVLGDPCAIEQALSNLLENALKYSEPDRAPIIEIGGQEHGNLIRLWVRDNGIGFDMGYHDRIFEIFRRLHTYSQYDGTGIGLALVKRAMERMGGKVWAESEPGKGATFFLEFRAAHRSGDTESPRDL